MDIHLTKNVRLNVNSQRVAGDIHIVFCLTFISKQSPRIGGKAGGGMSRMKGSTFAMMAAVVVFSALVLTVCNGKGNGKLTTTVTPANAGTVTRYPDQTVYPAGITVELTATAAPGYKFKEWTGVTTGTQNPVSIAMAGNMKMTAVFEEYHVEAVKIGNQTWMAKNLNIETPESWCYGDSPDNCTKYGRLYTWDAAMKVCPAGWHLPDRREWSELVRFAGGGDASTKLKSKSQEWNGTDDYGFSALPGGNRKAGGSFSDLGSWGSWWTATEDYASYAYRRDMGSGNTLVYENGNGHKSSGQSVRCVQD
jgi:uncharacterized protein (TIGR02145 family)